MANITERNKQKVDLANAGFAMKYIDDWQAKTVLFRHKASVNSEGKISGAVGTTITGVPGNPDYVLRKSKIGLFPWKPEESCTCQWCRETDGKAQEPTTIKGFCNSCGFEAEAKNSSGIGAKLAFHKKAEHPDV